MSKLVGETFHIHSEPKLIKFLPQQKVNLILSALTVVFNDKIQDRYLTSKDSLHLRMSDCINVKTILRITCNNQISFSFKVIYNLMRVDL